MKRSGMLENLSIASRLSPFPEEPYFCSGKGVTLKMSASKSSKSLSFLGTVLNLILIMILGFYLSIFILGFYLPSLPPPPSLFTL